MKTKLGELMSSARVAAAKTSKVISDAIEHEDTQAAIGWAKKTATATADEAARLGKAVAQSDLAKDAATGAAIGAVVAVPIPVIGPIGGAVFGAGIGVYKNITREKSSTAEIKGPEPETGVATDRAPPSSPDVYDQLIKFDDLRQKGIITEAEFEEQKRKLLGSG